jgi:hypothetical protein
MGTNLLLLSQPVAQESLFADSISFTLHRESTLFYWASSSSAGASFTGKIAT